MQWSKAKKATIKLKESATMTAISQVRRAFYVHGN